MSTTPKLHKQHKQIPCSSCHCTNHFVNPPKFDHGGQANDEIGLLLVDLAGHIRDETNTALWEQLTDTYGLASTSDNMDDFIQSLLEEAAQRLGYSRE